MKAQFNTFTEVLKRNYISQTVNIVNYKMFGTTLAILLLILHSFACAWIYIGLFNDGWLHAELRLIKTQEME